MKLKSIFLATALFLSMASSAQILYQGTTGNLTWEITSDRVLTVSDSGDMPDYTAPNFAPWYPYRTCISTVVIGDSVTKIGSSAFHYHEDLTDATIGNGVTTIGIGAFASCKELKSVNFPIGLATIGAIAFQSCRSLKSVTFPNSVTDIQLGAFGATGLVSITIPDGVKSITPETFMNCRSLTSVIMSGVTIIERQAFHGCDRLDTVMLSNSLTTIEINAFAICTKLSNITFPENVTSIGDRAFDYCTGLKSITSHARTPPTVGSLVFNNVSIPLPVYIPCGTYEAYCTAWYWAWGKNNSHIDFNGYIDLTRDTSFYSASFKQGETYNDANFTDLTVADKYCKTLQSVDGCDSIVCLTLTYNGTGITETDCNLFLPKVYPNPAQSQFTVTNSENSNIQLFNVLGQKVLDIYGTTENTVISTASLPQGMYILKVRREDFSTVHKVEVVR